MKDLSSYPGKEMDKANQEAAFAKPQKMTLKTWASEFSRYHGLSKRDAIFFNQSDLICDMAKHEDFIVMGRCADVILTNNHIPHISIFITAPFEQRLLDLDHQDYYHFFTGRKWGNASNYDLCLNSAAYGIDGSVDFILRMLDREGKTNLPR